MTVNSKPVEYNYELDSSTHNIKNSVYINGTDINDKTLNFEIRVDAFPSEETVYYKLKMFIDTNSDGRYNELTEQLDSIYVKNKDASKVSDRGNASLHYLTPGETYTVTREI